ncbi:type II secretion system protein [Methylobacillus sp. Pita2]|uniref:type II secretion system protein n=1 Tax=Methylobacillus sp. Pita2 TaxID=3383245 RepID=UPI0038B64FEA
METMTGYSKIKRKQYADGFSLVEMAVVLVILGFVISALVLPVTAQRDAGLLRKTENQLELAQKALIGFAQASGRLPCPATQASKGVEVPEGGGQCEPTAQLLPAVTLGLHQLENGFAIDGWGQHIKYIVTQTSNSAFTTNTVANSMAYQGLSTLNPNDLQVLNENNIVTIGSAVAIIYSDGANGIAQSRIGETGQFYNYISADFDDIVTWISPYVLYNAMIQAGQLP